MNLCQPTPPNHEVGYATNRVFYSLYCTYFFKYKVVSSLIYYTFNLFKFQSSNLMVLEVQRLASETTQQSLLKEIQRTNNLGMHYQSKITCKNLTA